MSADFEGEMYDVEKKPEDDQTDDKDGEEEVWSYIFLNFSPGFYLWCLGLRFV